MRFKGLRTARRRSLRAGKACTHFVIRALIWLKVGKAGPNSNARWQSQHYNSGAAMSNLACALLRYAQLGEAEDPRLPAAFKLRLQGVKPEDIGDWIKQHTDRCNLLLDARLGRCLVSNLETLAIATLKPVFEGRWAFRGPRI